MIKNIIYAILMGIFGLIISILTVPGICIMCMIYMIWVCIRIGYTGKIFSSDINVDMDTNKYKNI